MMSIKCPGGLGVGPQRGLVQNPRGPYYNIIIIHLYILTTTMDPYKNVCRL